MYEVTIVPEPVDSMITECDGCDEWVRLDVPEEVFIGGECGLCGYYTTRYQPGMEPI